jgi:hypothetical protein
VNRGVNAVERRAHAAGALPLDVMQMRVLRPEDLDLSSNATDLLASNDLVVFLHRERIVQVDVLRLPLALVLDGDDASIRWIFGISVVRLFHRAGSRREDVLPGADVRTAIEPDQIETVLIGIVAVVGGCTPYLTTLERQLECGFHRHSISPFFVL